MQAKPFTEVTPLRICLLGEEAVAQYLSALGYRCISRASSLVARIDREDWVRHLAQQYDQPEHALYDGSRPSGLAADSYRRTFSKDVVVVPKISLFETSNHDPIGYVDKTTMKEVLPKTLWDRLLPELEELSRRLQEFSPAGLVSARHQTEYLLEKVKTRTL